MKEMKVRSVIVDNLPDSCTDCRLTKWSTDGKRMYCFCVVRNEMVNLIDYPNSRPLNCPLRLESDNDKLKIDVDSAMDAINKPEDPCGFSIEVCESDENRLSDKEKSMKVETKYSLGDTVWIERFNFDKNEYVPDERKIVQIAIYIRENSLNIIYSLDTLYLQSFSEDQLYASKKECQEVCDKKNKMGRR